MLSIKHNALFIAWKWSLRLRRQKEKCGQFLYMLILERILEKINGGNCGQRKRNETITGFLGVTSMILGNLRKIKGEKKDL